MKNLILLIMFLMLLSFDSDGAWYSYRFDTVMSEAEKKELHKVFNQWVIYPRLRLDVYKVLSLYDLGHTIKQIEEDFEFYKDMKKNEDLLDQMR